MEEGTKTISAKGDLHNHFDVSQAGTNLGKYRKRIEDVYSVRLLSGGSLSGDNYAVPRITFVRNFGKEKSRIIPTKTYYLRQTT